MYVTYTAARSLVAGHVVGVQYTLALTSLQTLKRNLKSLREVQESLSGHVEVQYYGQVARWTVDLAPITLNQFALLREFLDSTAGGDDFEFDPYGTVSDPSDALTVVTRDDEGYDETRWLAKGHGGQDDYITVSFTVREIAT